jgi:hypothetical protein
VVSNASALAPFSQNSKVFGLCSLGSGDGQAQDEHLNPSGLFIASRVRVDCAITLCSRSTLAVAPSAPQPPAGWL